MSNSKNENKEKMRKNAKIKISKLYKRNNNQKKGDKKYTIYYQDNREMTVVNIVNPQPGNVAKSHSDNLANLAAQRVIAQNTPYFGQTRSNVSPELVSGMTKAEEKDCVKNLSQKFAKEIDEEDTQSVESNEYGDSFYK